MTRRKFDDMLMCLLYGATIGMVYATIISMIDPGLTEGLLGAIGGVVCVLSGTLTILLIGLFEDFMVDP